MPTEIYIPIILGITQVLKQVGIDTKWSPLLSLVAGVVLAGLTAGFNTQAILQGITWGLAASGLWSSGKTALGAIKKA